MIAKKKQIEIIDKSKEIENLLENKYKRMPEGTFGSKVKFFQEKNKKNPFLINSLWFLVQIRNHTVHSNDFEITLKEYELFLANYEYVKKYIK